MPLPTLVVPQLLDVSPCLQLLITSRVSWPIGSGSSSSSEGGAAVPFLGGYEEYLVKPLEDASLIGLIRSICPYICPILSILSDGEVERVAAASGGSPLLARLAADALRCGRKAMEVGAAAAALSGQSPHL